MSQQGNPVRSGRSHPTISTARGARCYHGLLGRIHRILGRGPGSSTLGTMIYLRPLVVLLGCVAGGAILGGTAGYGIGKAAPHYYRAVFDVAAGDSFDAVEAGVGLGVSQGLVAGAVLGTILVVTVELCARRGRE